MSKILCITKKKQYLGYCGLINTVHILNMYSHYVFQTGSYVF